MLTHINSIAKYTGTDMFLLYPKVSDPDTAGISYATGAENGLDRRFRCAIYGDMESIEHAKTRALMMIDQIVCEIENHMNDYLTPCSSGTKSM